MASGKMASLRAMFEQNNSNSDTSPPAADRGRSPGGSAGNISASTSPRRPLSKVQTSFVAVERSGQLGNQLGLKRDTSGEPSMTKRRTSFSIDEEEHPQSKAERKQSIATEMLARKLSAGIDETVPEVAVMTPLQTPALEEDKQLGKTNGKENKKMPVKVNKAEEKKSAIGQPSNGHTNGATKPTTAKVVDKPAATKTTTKPTPISTAKTTVLAKSSPKKLPLPKTPTTPNKPRMRDSSTNTPEKKPEAEKKPEKKSSRASLAPNNTTRPASKPPTTAAHGSAPKTRIPASPPQTGFHKPRPKSPTKPVKLPASLTAHTTSSGSKTANAPPPSRQSLSRASGNIQGGSTRSPSRATVTSKSDLARNPSILKSASNRPSLGPPPSNLKKQPSRASLSQSTAPADEGFLARMMRPTTSSASKTAEKPPTTPPKISQPVKRLATRDRPMKRSGSPLHETHKETAPKAVAKPVVKAAKSTKKVETPVKQAKKTSEKPAEAPVEESSVPKAESQTEEAKAEETKVEEPVKDEPNVAKAPKEESAVPEVDEPEPAVEEKPILSEITPVPTDETVEIPETTKEEPVAEKAEVEEAEALTDILDEASVAKVAQESTKVGEQTPAPKEVAPAGEEEDAEDAKAREEIAKLNAGFATAALED